MLRYWYCAALLLSLSAHAVQAQEGPQLLYVSAGSGNPEIILKQPDVDPAILNANTASDIFPYWSRNGKRIAYSSNRTGRFQIYSMDALGAGAFQVSLERTADSLSPSWSPTGEHIVYQHGRDHKWELVVITADGEEWRPIVKNAWQPDWSPPREQGDRIAFVGAEHDAGLFIYTCEPSGIDIRRIHRLANRIGLVHPIWSPDAKLIAFTDRLQSTDRQQLTDGKEVTHRQHKSHEIFVCGPEGQNVRALTKLGLRNVYPNWTPDGKHITFLHERPDHLWQTMMVNVETLEVTALKVVPVESFILGRRASWF